jgi:hypothetical protein
MRARARSADRSRVRMVNVNQVRLVCLARAQGEERSVDSPPRGARYAPIWPCGPRRRNEKARPCRTRQSSDPGFGLSALRFGQCSDAEEEHAASELLDVDCTWSTRSALHGFAPAGGAAAAATVVTGSTGTTTSIRASGAERVGIETGAVTGVMKVRIERKTNLY